MRQYLNPISKRAQDNYMNPNTLKMLTSIKMSEMVQISGIESEPPTPHIATLKNTIPAQCRFHLNLAIKEDMMEFIGLNAEVVEVELDAKMIDFFNIFKQVVVDHST